MRRREQIVINPNNPLGNLTSLPLCKRGRACEGAEGDFCVPATLKSPLAPLLQRGECVVIARIRSNGLSGINRLTIEKVIGKLAEFAESSKHAAWRYNLIALSDINYLVPDCMASYSAAINTMELRESNGCQSRPRRRHQADRKSAG